MRPRTSRPAWDESEAGMEALPQVTEQCGEKWGPRQRETHCLAACRMQNKN